METKLVLVTVRDSVKSAKALAHGLVLPNGKTIVSREVIDKLLKSGGFKKGEGYTT